MTVLVGASASLALTAGLAAGAGSPISTDYASPNPFNGKVDTVTIDLVQ